MSNPRRDDDDQFLNYDELMENYEEYKNEEYPQYEDDCGMTDNDVKEDSGF